MFSSKIKYVTRVQVEAEVGHWGQGVLGGKREEAVDWTGLRRAWELSWVCALGGFGQSCLQSVKNRVELEKVNHSMTPVCISLIHKKPKSEEES